MRSKDIRCIRPIHVRPAALLTLALVLSASGFAQRRALTAEDYDAPAFISDLKLLADHDLSLDLVGGSEILPFADRLAKEVPNLRIIIDHLAGVVVDGKAPPPEWIQQMKTLGRRPNVYCKVSGLVEGTGGRRIGSARRRVLSPGAGCDAGDVWPGTLDLRQ